MFEETKIPEQTLDTARKILILADNYSPDELEITCKKAMSQYHLPTYNTLLAIIKNQKETESNRELPKKAIGMVRGADYYKNGGLNE